MTEYTDKQKAIEIILSCSLDSGSVFGEHSKVMIVISNTGRYRRVRMLSKDI